MDGPVETGLEDRGFSVVKTDYLRSLEQNGVALRREAVGRELWQTTGGVVRYGPFAGQAIDGALCTSWPDMASMLLGQYECELRGAIHQIVRMSPDLVVNIGSGDGYYAVGLARLVPEARVVARDVDEYRCRVAIANAQLNRVERRIEVGGAVTFDDLQEILVVASCAVLLVDIEGGERELLNPDVVCALAASSVLVEVHDHMATNATSILQARFEGTHVISHISEADRRPSEIPELALMAADDRWAVMSEGRASVGSWLWMTPRGGADGGG